jgi:hypothetical protein
MRAWRAEKPSVGVEDGGLVLFCDDAFVDFALASHCFCLWRCSIGSPRVQAVLAAPFRTGSSKPRPHRHRGEPGQQHSQGPVESPAGTHPYERWREKKQMWHPSTPLWELVLRSRVSLFFAPSLQRFLGFLPRLGPCKPGSTTPESSEFTETERFPVV